MSLSRVSSSQQAGVAAAVAMILSGAVHAADPASIAPATPAADSLDQVIVTGTRRAERTVLESKAPIDVVSGSDLQSVFTPDINFKLQALVPSYNVRRIPTADGTIFVRPATLRNLSPDHTLVLVNGKRFHRSAFVDVTARGAHAVDLSLIPASAIKRTEVLRDGAAAQYGSDAIAGVINFILDDQPGTSAYAQFGQFRHSDGQNLQVGASTGFRFGSGGYVNLSGEYIDGNASNTGTQWALANLIHEQGEPYTSAVESIGEVVQRYGQPELEQIKFFVNSGYELANGTTLYAFANYSDQSGVGDFNYRPSLTLTGPNADGDIVTLTRNPGYNIRNPNGYGSSIYDPDWRLLDVYPGGFTPRFGSDTRDYGFTAGVKGSWGQNLTWDLSAGLGSNEIQYWMNESINLSYGAASPLDFPNLGSREQREQNVNLDFVYQWQTALASPVNVGFGLEYRHEEFSVRAGSEESWNVGPLRDLSPAANGFPGAHPLSAGAWSGYNTAAYVDFDVDLTDRLSVNLAGRFEDFSLFGNTLNGKLAARFELTDALSLRGSASTGFRAPTAGQQYLQNISQNPQVNPDIPRSVDVRAQLPSNSVAASIYGGVALRPEESVNLSLGLVLQPVASFSVTVDGYLIDIEDRIGFSRYFEPTVGERALMAAAGVPLANELTHVRFFTNSYDTRTSGVDLVATWRGSAGRGRLGATLASNYNYTEFTKYNPEFLDQPTRVQFLRNVPRFGANLSLDYVLDSWTLTGRARHFGEWVYAASTSGAGIFETIGAETFFDLIGTYRFSKNVDATLGVENLLDNYTQQVQLVTVRNNGRLYPGGAPYENNGRQIYARLGISF